MTTFADTDLLSPRDRAPSVALSVEGLRVHFGGLKAVDDVSLVARESQITGLIGPNGAGKTTTFAACSGLQRPTSGRVMLHGHDVTGMPPHSRAQRGMGRTFQRMELFDSLSVYDNVALGAEAGMAGSLPWRHLRSSGSQWRDVNNRAGAAIDRCGLATLARHHPSELSTGQRRLVELARVIAGEFSVMLLDEPSSGLDKTETRTFGSILRGIVDDTASALLLVEHDMGLVMSVCDYIYVLDFGKLIFEGSASAVTASPLVRAAYLGAELEEDG
jgi:ABC-type branched-subunit amino acid transport system ATPase component